MKKQLFFIVMAIFASMSMMAQNYFVAGSSALCNGQNWNANAEVNKMTLTATNVYSATFSNIAAGTFEFKITDGTWTNSWGYSDFTGGAPVENGSGNVKFTTGTTSDITITFNSSTRKILEVVSSNGFGTLTITSYTVVGDAGLAGTAWDVANTANDMTYDNGESVWKKVFTGIAAGAYDYKVVGNHAYEVFQFPAGTGNESMTIAADNSTVTVIFNAVNSTLTYTQAVTTGVNDITSDVDAVKEYYTVLGTKLSEKPERGMFIEKTIKSDGTSSSKKIIR